MKWKLFRFTLGLCVGLLLSAVLARADSSPGFSLILDPSGITPAESAPLESFVASVAQLIPDGMKAGIGRPIRVRFSKMGNLSQLLVPACMGVPGTAESSSSEDQSELLGHDQFNGHSSVVDVNALFKQEILKGPNGTRTYPCGHHSMYQLAIATLVHELAHVYDADLGAQQSTKNSYFQKLMGFTEQWSWDSFLFRAVQAKNHLFFRSPDPYEFKNIKESFAVNMEFFVLDPDFGCRRPTVDQYYRSLLGIKFAPSCTLNTTIYENSDNTALNLKSPINLDPSRIYDIHYMFASQADAIMSRWGHAMFRVIVCAPDRKVVGPECMNDIAYHVVLSYRADVQDLVLSEMKGLFGEYPSQLYIFPLAEIMTEYNKLQFRDLESYPLELTAEQKQQFIYRTLEQYWEYQGRYYFLTNNCASEALSFLQGIVDSDKIQKLQDMSPLGLKIDLQKDGLTDGSVLKNRQQAIAEGYLFPSKKPILDDAFKQINAHIANLPVHDSKSYMNSTTAEQRADFFNAIMKSTSGEDHIKMAAYFYLVESYISSIDEQNLGSDVSKRLESSSVDGLGSDLVKTLQADQPWSKLSSGYGIPQPSDFDSVQTTADSSQKSETLQKLQDWMKSQFKDDLDEFQRIQENLSTFRKSIVAPPVEAPAQKS